MAVTATGTDVDSLCSAARDVTRHIGALVDELVTLRHPHGQAATPNPALLEKQIARIRDQILLLSSVVEDIARHEAGYGGSHQGGVAAAD